ncbi:MAG: hypothetical protein ACK5LP_00925 [Campylobacteraceae bacterium]
MTKNEVIKKIKELLSKDKFLSDCKLEVIFKDKKTGKKTKEKQ